MWKCLGLSQETVRRNVNVTQRARNQKSAADAREAAIRVIDTLGKSIKDQRMVLELQRADVNDTLEEALAHLDKDEIPDAVSSYRRYKRRMGFVRQTMIVVESAESHQDKMRAGLARNEHITVMREVIGDMKTAAGGFSDKSLDALAEKYDDVEDEMAALTDNVQQLTEISSRDDDVEDDTDIVAALMKLQAARNATPAPVVMPVPEVPTPAPIVTAPTPIKEVPAPSRQSGMAELKRQYAAAAT